ncbi:YSIRK-type signal peptide-containing protein, partial [Streptococcus pseudopneumoniae]|uniref:YSIRK-type signal peptide-containing protein n=1 Tax=Streptococcus pseudopneumoniae TaxID=257758 RepID=UPI00352D87F9
MKKFKLKRGTSNMFYSEKDDREKRLRFSIRKVSFGAASVAVAALYLFMGSGAVSAEEAQAVQSNEKVAADKDSEIEEQQPTYAAPAAKEQGSVTNTEAGDEGKQESHPETKEEEANSSERRETTTKTQSDEDSVSGDSSSPKSEGEGTKSEEASSKPKVRKRRDADPAPPATAADADSAANQVYTAPEDDASVGDLANKLEALPETVENEKKLASIDQVGATKNITPGQVRDLDEFGGWKAVNGGKFGVARKTDKGVFPIETVNTVLKGTDKYNTWTQESVFNRDSQYALFLSKVRTKSTRNLSTFDKSMYMERNEGMTISKGLEGFNGIEKTFKVYSQVVGSSVEIAFNIGYTGDIDGRKATYKVELLGEKENNDTVLYSVTFDPSKSTSDNDKSVTKATEINSKLIEVPKTGINKDILNNKLAESTYSPKGIAGMFKSKKIDIPVGYTDYKVRISSNDNQHLGMGYQVEWEHYALPITGTGFAVTQDTSKVAKDLSQKVYDKLKAQKEQDTKWSTSETEATYEEKLQKIKDNIDSGVSTSAYKTVVKEALEKQKTLNEEKKIKHKAADEIAEKAAEKLVKIDDDETLSENEKRIATEKVIAEAEKAAQKVKIAIDQDGVEKAKTDGIDAITKV